MPTFILVVVVVIFFNFFTGIQIDKAKTDLLKKTIFTISTVVNISVLVFYKYINFIIENLNFLTSNADLDISLPYLSILLPLGISFYVFQVISYNYDIYWEIEKPERHIGHFATYLLFFPKFISGPIERANLFLPQIKVPKKFEVNNVVSGLQLILWGLFKKLVIADRIATTTNLVFNDVGNYHGLSIIIATVLYTIQLYADFSGYTDIALGLARTLGYKLTDNFNRPFSATSISDFWRRWHITLSSWVIDYIYTPVSAERRSWNRFGIVYALFITFIVLGVWHGASWNFVIYGVLHALAVTYEFLTKKFRRNLSVKIPSLIYNSLSNYLTIAYFAFTLIFFRVVSLSGAITAIRNIFTGFSFTSSGLGLGLSLKDVIIISLGTIIIIQLERLKAQKGSFGILLASKSSPIRWTFYYLVVLSIMIFGSFGANNFIYFQF
ncbi:MAG: MBOAT family protein [Bacteroidales bacterium]|nr:hypothetical protein [Saprospiraceae bacterium]MCF8381580.1 MBOAT family protein [Bacteroidales bacterium]